MNRSLTKNSKKAINPTNDMKWAMAAMTDANFVHEASIDPNKREIKKSPKRIAAFQTTGPTAMIAMRIKGLGLGVPSALGKDLTNMYATTKIVETQIGQRISEKMTALQPARGTSLESFSEGWPNFFFLKPVIIVLERRQYPYQLLLCDRALPLDIHRRNSR